MLSDLQDPSKYSHRAVVWMFSILPLVYNSSCFLSEMESSRGVVDNVMDWQKKGIFVVENTFGFLKL